MAAALGDPSTPDTFSRGEILSAVFMVNMHAAPYQFPLEQTLALHPSGRIADAKALMDRFEAYDITRVAMGADRVSSQMSYTAATNTNVPPPSTFAAPAHVPATAPDAHARTRYAGPPCPHCLSVGWTLNARNHPPFNCAINPRSQ